MSAYATNRFAGDGVTTAYAINFIGGYIAREHVKAYREDNITKERTTVTILPGQFVGPYQLNGFAPTPVGQTFVLHRATPAGPLVSFVNGSHFTAVSLDIVARQGLFLAAEALDNAGTATGGGGGGGVTDEDLEAALAEVRALAAQVDGQVSTVTTAAADAIAAKNAADQSRTSASSSASAASTSAGGAAASATSAVSSMTAAAASATAAGTSATNAGNSATAASTSATNAGNSATAASGSATAAANSASAAAASATAASAAAGTASGRQEALNAMASAQIAELAAVSSANSASGAAGASIPHLLVARLTEVWAPAGTYWAVPYNNVISNTGGGAYNTTSGAYTVPVSGVYSVSHTVGHKMDASSLAHVAVYVNGTSALDGTIVQSNLDDAANFVGISAVGNLRLSAGEVVTFRVLRTVASSGIGDYGYGPNWSGRLCTASIAYLGP